MSTAIVKTEKEMSFVPFGAADPVRLTVEIIKNIVAVKTKSGQTCSDKDAIEFMMLCQAQRLNPFTKDCYLVGYDGQKGATFSMITAHSAFLKRAEASPDYEGMESGIIILEEDGKIVEREGDFKLPTEKCVGGWAKVYRKGRRPTYRRLSMEAMKPRYETDFWSEHKAPGQIVKCSESDALRATFPTLLGGLHTHAEIDGTGITIEMVQTPKQTVPNFDGPVLPKPEPQKVLVAAPVEPEQAPATTAPQEPASETLTLGTPQEHLLSILEDNHVDPALFINYISVNGVDKKHGEDISKYDSINEFADVFCGKLAADKAMIARVIAKFGKK